MLPPPTTDAVSQGTEGKLKPYQHPPVVLTVKVPLPPEAGTLTEGGVSAEMLHVDVFCVTLKLYTFDPLTVIEIVALRFAEVLFDAILKLTEAELPELLPDTGANNVIQDGCEFATLQVQPDVLVKLILTDPLPPAGSTKKVPGLN